MVNVSVIVPVYKVEAYLSRCVDSILNQTFTDFELILVDDGSPDGCPAICDEYVTKDTRVKVIHKENGGLSSARNAGLDVATGEYVLFVDSDDYIAPETLEKTHAIARKTSCNLVIFDYVSVYEDGRENERIANTLAPIEQWTINDFWHYYFATNGLPYSIAVNKLYKHTLFDSLRFENGRIHEDEFILYDVIKASNGKIVLLNEALYFYYRHENSITGKRNYKGAMDAVISLFRRAAKLEEDGLGTYCGLCLRRCLLTYYGIVTESSWSGTEKKEIMQLVKKNVRQFKLSSSWSVKSKVAVALCKIHPGLLLTVINVYKKIKSIV